MAGHSTLTRCLWWISSPFSPDYCGIWQNNIHCFVLSIWLSNNSQWTGKGIPRSSFQGCLLSHACFNYSWLSLCPDTSIYWTALSTLSWSFHL